MSSDGERSKPPTLKPKDPDSGLDGKHNTLRTGREGFRKRGIPIALLSPPARAKTPKARQRPDFAARLKRVYGDKILPGDLVVEG